MDRSLVFVVAFAVALAACAGGEPDTSDDKEQSSHVVNPVATTGRVTTVAPTTTMTAFTAPMAPPLSLALEVVADGFDQPVLALSPPGDSRLFVVDQPGRIYVMDGEEIHTFLDIRGDVRFGGEQGLLGMAFHPGFVPNGLYYVDYINNAGDTVLAEFSVSGNPNVASKESCRDVVTVDQPASNHNGGMIAFGPDGYLWFGLGDGGGANDRFGNGQRSDRRLASMIRIAVGPEAPKPYADPAERPFADEGGLREVWAIGLRNPWR